MPETFDLSSQLAKSASTDIGVLLKAKEDAKRAVLDDPSPKNLVAFEKATKMLDNAQNAQTDLKDWNAVLSYVEESGKKLKKTKLYDDIGKGRLKRQPDGSFKLRDVDRYAATLPTLGTSDKVARDAATRQKRREEAEIRRIENAAAKERFQLDVLRGRYVSRDQVYLELATRAVTLASGLKTAFEAEGMSVVHLVDGNPKKLADLMQKLESILDAALNEYATLDEFEVMFVAPEGVSLEDDDPETGEKPLGETPGTDEESI